MVPFAKRKKRGSAIDIDRKNAREGKHFINSSHLIKELFLFVYQVTQSVFQAIWLVLSNAALKVCLACYKIQ